jgi:hypothetical protein
MSAMPEGETRNGDALSSVGVAAAILAPRHF